MVPYFWQSLNSALPLNLSREFSGNFDFKCGDGLWGRGAENAPLYLYRKAIILASELISPLVTNPYLKHKRGFCGMGAFSLRDYQNRNHNPELHSYRIALGFGFGLSGPMKVCSGKLEGGKLVAPGFCIP